MVLVLSPSVVVHVRCGGVAATYTPSSPPPPFLFGGVSVAAVVVDGGVVDPADMSY